MLSLFAKFIAMDMQCLAYKLNFMMYLIIFLGQIKLTIISFVEAITITELKRYICAQTIFSMQSFFRNFYMRAACE